MIIHCKIVHIGKQRLSITLADKKTWSWKIFSIYFHVLFSPLRLVVLLKLIINPKDINVRERGSEDSVRLHITLTYLSCSSRYLGNTSLRFRKSTCSKNIYIWNLEERYTTVRSYKIITKQHFSSAAVERAFKDDIYVELHSFPAPNVAR